MYVLDIYIFFEDRHVDNVNSVVETLSMEMLVCAGFPGDVPWASPVYQPKMPGFEAWIKDSRILPKDVSDR